MILVALPALWQVFFIGFSNLLSLLALSLRDRNHSSKTHNVESLESDLAPTQRSAHIRAIRQKKHRYSHTVSDSKL